MVVKRASIDTNVILRLILRDDIRATEMAIRLVTEPRSYYFVYDIVIFEVIYVLNAQYGFSREAAVRSLKKVLSFPRLEYREPIINMALEYYATHPKLSFADCYLAVTTEDEGKAPLYTFDRKLAMQMPGTELVGQDRALD